LLTGSAPPAELANAIVRFELKAEDGKTVATGQKRRDSADRFLQLMGIDGSIPSGKYQVVATTRVSGQDLMLRSKPVEILAQKIPQPPSAPTAPQRITLEPSEAAAAMQSKLSDLANTLLELTEVINALSEELEIPEFRDGSNAMRAVHGIVFDAGFPLSLESLKSGGTKLQSQPLVVSRGNDTVLLKAQLERQHGENMPQVLTSFSTGHADASLLMDTFRLRQLLQSSYMVGSNLALNEQRDPPVADANLRKLAEVYRQQLAVSGAMRAEQLAHSIQLQAALQSTAASLENALDIYAAGMALVGEPASGLIEKVLWELTLAEVAAVVSQNLIGYAASRLPSQIVGWRTDLPASMKVGQSVVPKYWVKPAGTQHNVGSLTSTVELIIRAVGIGLC
jgi:hypothetical protein